ncbi:MAG: patatin-like phospholipase family protein [Rubrivivax sp.]
MKFVSHLSPQHEAYLLAQLRALFEDPEDAEITRWRERLRNVELAAGEVLMAQGEAGDSMYLLLSGRLRVFIPSPSGRVVVGELNRGQFIGEMSMYTDQPRTATLVAIRDSVLVRLDKADFPVLLASSPKASIHFTQRIIERLLNNTRRPLQVQPVTITLMPVTAGLDAQGFALRLMRHLACHGSTCLVGSDGVLVKASDQETARGASRAQAGDGETLRGAPTAEPPAIAVAGPSLDDLEAAHDFVLLLADDEPSEWTLRCARQADETLLLADASQPAALHPNETHPDARTNPETGAAEVLVLLHADDTHAPRDTARWLDRRPVADHLHLRPGLERDMARLARVVSRNAVGLVLSGGGARGMSHLGVWRALAEHGIDVDYVGGTSIGSIMTSLIAADRPLALLNQVAQEALGANPTGDVNPVPVLSLVKGQRVKEVIGRVVERLFGFPADVEDLWKNAFCVATNFSTASEDVARRGPLARAILASIAIPGALPPVLRDGHMLCDGGTLNNFPVDVMRRMRGVRRVIGVDLGGTESVKVDLTEVPSHWQLLLDRLRPPRLRRYSLPTFMGYLINALLLHSMSRQRLAAQSVDLYFKPELGKVGLLEWKKAPDIEQRGYQHAKAVLEGLDDAALKSWQAPAASSPG